MNLKNQKMELQKTQAAQDIRIQETITLEGFQEETWKNSLVVAESLHSTEKEVVDAMCRHEIIGRLFMFFPEQSEDRFRQLIAKCLVICSISKEHKPDEVTISVLWDYTKKHLKNYTFQEIEKAFLFNASGHFSERVEHFHAFDISYFSKVMELWLIFKTKTRQRISGLLPPITPKPETDEESYNGLVNYCQKHGEFPKFWAWSKVYNHMDECLMIEETNDSKQIIYDQVYEKLKNKLDLDILDMKNASDRKERAENLPNDVKTECRRIMVQKYLKTS